MRALVSVLDFKSRLHSILGIVILRCLAQLCTNMFPLSLKQMVTECGLRKNLVSFQWPHGNIWPLQGIAGPIQPSSPLADGSLHCYNRFKHESSNLHLITFAYSPPPPPPPPLLHRRQRRSILLSTEVAFLQQCPGRVQLFGFLQEDSQECTSSWPYN